MGNCSCINNTPEFEKIFPDEKKLNLEEMLNEIKTQLKDVYISIEPFSKEEFDKILYSFPNSKELLEEYNTKIMDPSQKEKDLINTSQSSNEDTLDKDLIELPNPIKLYENEEKYDLFKGSINKNNNFFTGKGCYITNDYIYNGFFQNNEFNGKGLMINKDGSSLFGDWVNGICTGKGILKINNLYEYEGDFVGNKKHGFGIEKYPDGSKYEGEFLDNKKNGKGKYLNGRGETYEGEFKNDLFDGEGIYKWPLESREYKGQFKNGNMNGKGINKYKDGSIYEGNYKNGLKHGLGKYTWPNGKIFYGSWLNNKLHGNGYYLLDNEKFNITFRFGKIISTRKAEEIDENQRIRFGYNNIVDKENLEDANKYICPICLCVLYQPNKCCGCSKNYCIDCIKDNKENKKCSNCGGNEYELNLELLHDLISKIKVNCNVCNSILDYESSLNHYHHS